MNISSLPGSLLEEYIIYMSVMIQNYLRITLLSCNAIYSTKKRKYRAQGTILCIRNDHRTAKPRNVRTSDSSHDAENEHVGAAVSSTSRLAALCEGSDLREAPSSGGNSTAVQV